MVTNAIDLHVTGVGCWLPCSRTTFYYPEDDANLVAESRGSYPLPTIPAAGHPRKLDCSVYRRLFTTLGHWGYREVHPVYSDQFRGQVTGAVFVQSQTEHPGSLPAGVRGMALVVDTDGFYGLIALYDHQTVQGESVQAELKKHLSTLAGGSFCSHEPGIGETVQLPENPTRPGRPSDLTLKQYRDTPLGILNFFQLNMILEGLYNSTLDFEVFFSGKIDEEDAPAERAKESYSLGSFTDLITVSLHLPSQSGADLPQTTSDQVAALFSGSTPMSSKTVMDTVLSASVKYHLLCSFLDSTALCTLTKLKLRIERCRRALLSEMIQVTQRRLPLVQAESPDTTEDPLAGVNEDQLRGYLLLLAAKLPLIGNVLLYVKELTEEQKRSASVEAHEFVLSYHSWDTLFSSIRSDLDGLDTAMRQAWSDRILEQEEQIRSEEETLAEIQRIQEHTSEALSPLGNITINLLSNVFALLAVVVALVSLSQAGLPKVTYPNIFTLQNAKVALDALALAFILGLGYIVVHVVVHIGLGFFLRLMGRQRTQNEPYYYELDIQLDVPIDAEYAQRLLIGESAWEHSHSGLPGEEQNQDTSDSQEPSFKKWPRRSSYRVERTSKDEATHKVYVEADIYLDRRRRWLRRRNRIHAVLVYELLFHRPSLEHGYIFKDLRVVTTYARELKFKELEVLKEAVATQFINRWIGHEEDLLQVDQSRTVSIDALMTLNVIHDRAPTAPARFLQRRRR